MPTERLKFNGRPAFITFGGDYKPGDQPPSGYLDWHDWAEVQHKAGLRQTQCGKCDGWKYQQEMSVKTITIKGYRDKKMTKPVKLKLRICNTCAAPSTGGAREEKG